MIKKINTKEILTEVNGTITELIQLLSSFDQQQINIIPFEGSWTAGQLAKHMIMSNSGFADIMYGPVKETEREPDELVERIKADFLNFNIKMKSPDFVVPPKTSYKREELLKSLGDIKEKINRGIETLALTKTCLAFELPVYGFLTRLEAIHFVLYHTQRHIHQLRNIFKKVVDK